MSGVRLFLSLLLCIAGSSVFSGDRVEALAPKNASSELSSSGWSLYQAYLNSLPVEFDNDSALAQYVKDHPNKSDELFPASLKARTIEETVASMTPIKVGEHVRFKVVEGAKVNMGMLSSNDFTIQSDTVFSGSFNGFKTINDYEICFPERKYVAKEMAFIDTKAVPVDIIPFEIERRMRGGDKLKAAINLIVSRSYDEPKKKYEEDYARQQRLWLLDASDDHLRHLKTDAALKLVALEREYPAPAFDSSLLKADPEIGKIDKLLREAYESKLPLKGETREQAQAETIAALKDKGAVGLFEDKVCSPAFAVEQERLAKIEELRRQKAEDEERARVLKAAEEERERKVKAAIEERKRQEAAEAERVKKELTNSLGL